MQKKYKMVDLNDKIKNIINQEIESKRFSVLDESSVNLIRQIISNYEEKNNLRQNFENLPKKAELIFVAAPTGAGKDSLVARLNNANPEKNYIELNMDMFRHYFSRFIPDVKLQDRTFADQTSEFSYEMYYTIQEVLLTEFPGTNIIITGTLWKTDWVQETFEKYKQNKNTDYSITLASLAVPEKDSAFSILKRYVSIVDTGILGKDEDGKEIYSKDFLLGSARYTSLDYHNATYDRFPESLRYFQNMFEKGELIDCMKVYRRSKKELDFSDDTLVYSSDNIMQSDQNALDTVIKLRNSESQITQDDIFSLFEVLTDSKNQSYFKSQNVIEEIVFDLAEILGKQDILKKHIAQRKRKFENPDTGENGGVQGDNSDERF